MIFCWTQQASTSENEKQCSSTQCFNINAALYDDCTRKRISTKKGNFTHFCGSLLILTILQVFSSSTTDYTAERLSTSKCRTETSMRDTEFTLRDTEPSMRRFTKSGTSTNENGVFAIASLWRFTLFLGIKVHREGWFSILHFWKWRQGIIYMCREKEKPRLLLFGCVKSKELGFSGVLY